MFQPGANLYTQGFASRPENVEVPHIDVRAPAATDLLYPLGKRWVDRVNQNEYTLVAVISTAGINSAVWVLMGGSSSVVSVLGTANQITATTAAGVSTISLPAAITTPGSLTTTTTLAAGTSLSAGTTVTAGTGVLVTTGGIQVSGGDIINSHSDSATDVTIEVTNSDNTSGTSRSGVEIATGGASSGDPYLSFEISGVGASTMIIGLDNSASDLFVISNSNTVGTSNALTLSQAGALTATTTITATLGDITATNGNIVRGTAGNKDVYTSVAAVAAAGANSAGSVVLVGGTIVVSTTSVTASSLIRLTRQSVGATGANDLGILSVGTIVAGVSFVINAWTVTDATALQADDVSIIFWEVVN